MPLIKNIFLPNGQIGVWKAAETEILPAAACLSTEDQRKADTLPPRRRQEFLMVRELLAALGINERISYLPSGKPFLAEDHRQISISHAFPFAAVGISTSALGLDLEHVHEKVRKVRERFLHEDEKVWLGENPELETLTVIWSAKESLYKLDERHYWSFRNHYRLEPFHVKQTQNLTAQVFDDEKTVNYQGKVWQMEDCVLTVAWKARL